MSVKLLYVYIPHYGNSAIDVHKHAVVQYPLPCPYRVWIALGRETPDGTLNPEMISLTRPVDSDSDRHRRRACFGLELERGEPRGSRFSNATCV